MSSVHGTRHELYRNWYTTLQWLDAALKTNISEEALCETVALFKEPAPNPFKG